MINSERELNTPSLDADLLITEIILYVAWTTSITRRHDSSNLVRAPNNPQPASRHWLPVTHLTMKLG
ncbi:MAG TPA: hypothetical protein VFQ92_00590 [Blastocatellia bacterium]|nr:hypothetical protein [Blastocatellia bacterium]